MEQAVKFLDHAEIRDASKDQKIAFLEGKGLKTDEIYELLGIPSDQESSSEEASIETATRSEVNNLLILTHNTSSN